MMQESVEQQNEVSDSVSDSEGSEQQNLDQELDEAYKNMTVPDDDKGKEPDSIDEFIGIDEEFSK